MISLEELLKDKKIEDISDELKKSLMILLDKINKLRSAYGFPMVITSCIRTVDDQIRIYKEKGITDKSKIPMKSKHLSCQAVDIHDPDGKLKKWIKNNIKLMEAIGLWFEDFSKTPTWVHVQIVPYGSYKIGGSLFFMP